MVVGKMLPWALSLKIPYRFLIWINRPIPRERNNVTVLGFGTGKCDVDGV